MAAPGQRGLFWTGTPPLGGGPGHPLGVYERRRPSARERRAGADHPAAGSALRRVLRGRLALGPALLRLRHGRRCRRRRRAAAAQEVLRRHRRLVEPKPQPLRRHERRRHDAAQDQRPRADGDLRGRRPQAGGGAGPVRREARRPPRRSPRLHRAAPGAAELGAADLQVAHPGARLARPRHGGGARAVVAPGAALSAHRARRRRRRGRALLPYRGGDPRGHQVSRGRLRRQGQPHADFPHEARQPMARLRRGQRPRASRAHRHGGVARNRCCTGCAAGAAAVHRLPRVVAAGRQGDPEPTAVQLPDAGTVAEDCGGSRGRRRRQPQA
mmetsp:Transcript_4651/g.13250  ORF Transcript_4651/g.13250 Transcript_4651/m.13250 type:complete len:327 (+) Transcript_4651:441-1421(+)